jgi:3-oxoacyl-[acyl-carrier-protein] synthase-1
VLRVGAVHDPLPKIPAQFAEYDCRNNAMTLCALSQIADPIARALREYGPERVGVVMGTSTSGVSDAEAAIRHELVEGGLTPRSTTRSSSSAGSRASRPEYLGVKGPAYSLSTACSSGARALATARSLLRLGVCDAVIAGAADTLCGLTGSGFSALSAVCDGVTNPCSVNRAGLTLGEGAAVFLVEPGRAACSCSASASRARRITCRRPIRRARAPSRRCAARSRRGSAARRDRLSQPARHGHAAERQDGVSRGRARVRRALPASSTKPLVGHTLGAAGAIEAAFCWLVLDRCERARSGCRRTRGTARAIRAAALHLVQKGETARAGSRRA